ncbi:hypothetical protein LAZ67_11002568 [Cordylochernes scorpioides]|uniref:Tc1-like transposase DDE domain-containing protein n=1 Tax=Cordylochernes scorpioides TaxID=51811 RepID=A0ABY6L1N3_9ARAC|nr:hypothetical protein LAZ67_11002568 [Cordylochernes scorpioides]
MNSGYPRNFILRHFHNPQQQLNSQTYRSTCIIPYSTYSVNISRHLKNKYGIRTYYTNTPKLETIVRNPITRNSFPITLPYLTNSVYSLKCSDCNSLYIGETGRRIKDRIDEHHRNIRNSEPRSLIVQHIRHTGHSFDTSHPQAYYSGIKSKYKRLVVEALLSLSHNSINRHIDIPDIYKAILPYCTLGDRCQSGVRAGQFIQAIARFWRKVSTTSALCGRALSSIRIKFSPISTDTIRRRLHMKGLYARRPIICVPLTPPQKRARELWRRKHVAWNPDEWRRVMFTDESRFSLNSYYRRVFVWREVGTRNNPRNMVERDPYRSQCFMVWVGIFLGGRTALYIFRQGTLTGQRYRDEILAAYVMLQALEMGENFLLMDDNARPHRAGVVDTFLQNHAIARMNWPARSPDLNPIEHVWDNLGRRISSLQPPPRNTLELETALTQEWALIPLELINSLILRRHHDCKIWLLLQRPHIANVQEIDQGGTTGANSGYYSRDRTLLMFKELIRAAPRLQNLVAAPEAARC